MIVTSNTSSTSSADNPANFCAMDGSNQYLWRSKPTPGFSAEEISRFDSVASADRWDTAMGGPQVSPVALRKRLHSPHFEFTSSTRPNQRFAYAQLFTFIAPAPQTNPFLDDLGL